MEFCPYSFDAGDGFTLEGFDGITILKATPIKSSELQIDLQLQNDGGWDSDGKKVEPQWKFQK